MFKPKKKVEEADETSETEKPEEAKQPEELTEEQVKHILADQEQRLSTIEASLFRLSRSI